MVEPVFKSVSVLFSKALLFPKPCKQWRRKELFYRWWESFLNIHIYEIMPSSVNQSSPTLCDPMDCSMSGFPVHHKLPKLAQTHVHWVGDAIQPSYPVIPFSCCLQSFPVSGYFPMSQFFASGGQSTGASTLASVLPMSIQDWFPLGLTGLISLQSKGLSRVFSNTTVQKHQLLSVQFSLWSNSHIHTRPLEKP